MERVRGERKCVGTTSSLRHSEPGAFVDVFETFLVDHTATAIVSQKS